MRRALLASLALASILALFSCGPRPADRWWADVRWLADDAREGRGTGTPGYLAAARYVAAALERAGAKPAGSDGYFQPVSLTRRKLRVSECSLALIRDGRADTLSLTEDVALRGSVDAPDSLEADAVFVGYGLTVPEYGVDDLAGLDLRGKIAICLRGGPRALPDDVRSHAMSGGERWRNLRRAGAIGFATILNPRHGEFSWKRYRAASPSVSFALADTALDDEAGQRFGATVNPASADKFFRGTGHSMKEILEAADRQSPLPRFPLAARIRARVRSDRSSAESPNVVGVVEGRDPALRHEAVVVSAHLDHLGVGRPVRGDSIYNGAMDNASGVATLLEVARAIGRPEARPRRSVVFLAVTGEEAGLLGSLAFIAHPTIGDREIVADVNLDMFLPIVPMRSLTDYGGEQSELGDWFRAVADSARVRVAPDPHPDRSYFTRSDQYRFVLAGVPSVFVEFGPTKNRYLDGLTERWNRQRYHRPSDDARQSLDFKAAADFNRLLTEFVRVAADRVERPRWKADSYFRKFARDARDVAPMKMAARAGGGGKR